jgi:hypothetical protein
MRLGERFGGPDGSANGGYAAGSFAQWAGAVTGGGVDAVEVTLRRPPPLATPLTVARAGSGARIEAPDGELVAEVEPVEPFSAIVAPVGWQAATAAAENYAGHRDHPFPRCYVCGPERADGLRIFPGRLPDGRTAAPFEVPAEVGPATVWAALDCPGGWSVIAPEQPAPVAGGGIRPYVLGRIAAVVTAVPAPGDRCVVLGAGVSAAGRKAVVHSTLYGPDGALLAYARATWIATRA